ncbi:MAG: tetratricopeptide repeat protein [Terracidiphilus sp.]
MIHRLLLIAFLAACAFRAPIAAAQKAPAASRPSVDQLLQAAGKARDENRDDEAIQLYRRAVAEDPGSEQGLWYLGTLLYEKAQYAEARDELRIFMTLHPDAGPGWALLGLSEYETRDYRRALDHLQHAMALGMGDRQELVQIVFDHVAVLLTRFERYDDSLDMLLKMLANGTQQPELIEPAGLAGLRLPLLPAEIPPDRRELVEMAGRAVLAVQTQHYEEAESEFNKLLAAYPNEPGVHFLHGAYLMELHPDRAVPEFERELEISPSHVLARVRLAQQLMGQGDFDRALALAQQAIKIEPQRASAHMMAGEALVAKGQSADGIKELEIARSDDPAVSRTHWDLLRAYAAAGRKEDAEREKQEIEKLYRSNQSGGSSAGGDIPHNQAAP